MRSCSSVMTFEWWRCTRRFTQTISFTTLVIVPMSCDTMTIAIRCFEQPEGFRPVFLRVPGNEAPVPLQPRQYHLQHRDRECPVEIADLGHISDQPLLAAEQLRGEHDLAGVGYRPEDRLHECRFPASVGAYYSQEIILCDREVDIFQRLVPVVRYADVV